MFLAQPFPAYEPSLKHLRFSAVAGVVVFLILVLFKPFGINNPPNTHLIRNAAIYGLATFIITTINAITLPQLFKPFFKEENWTVGKEMLLMLWHIISISLVNVLITHYLYGDPLTLNTAVCFLGITAAVGIFPVTLIVLLKQQMLLKKYTSEALVMEEQLQQKEVEEVDVVAPALVTFTGDNQSEKLEVAVTNLRYITSADNYIKIHYLTADKLTQTVLRSTLKKAEGAVQEHPQLFRCHRAFIVNLAVVQHVSGNAQGYKLHLKDVDEPIPVSRSLNNELAQHLSTYSSPSR